MKLHSDSNRTMEADTISKNGAHSKSRIRRVNFSKLGKIVAIFTVSLIGMSGLLKIAWASDFTEELARARINGKADAMANPAIIMSDALGTNVVAQICILVRDIETTAKAYGDFFGLRYRITESVPYDIAKTVYNGQPTPARCKMAFFQLGSVQLELIQPDEHPSVWREDLDRNGEGFHHIGFKVNDTPTVLKNLESMGIQTRMTGNWDTGCFAYVDAYAQLKIVMETLEDGRLLERK